MHLLNWLLQKIIEQLIRRFNELVCINKMWFQVVRQERKVQLIFLPYLYQAMEISKTGHHDAQGKGSEAQRQSATLIICNLDINFEKDTIEGLENLA